MNIKILASLLLTCAMLLLHGCASAGTRVEQSQVDQIEKGKTTKAELLAHLGHPNSVSLMGDGKESLLWIYSKAQIKGATWIPIYGIFRGGSDITTHTLQVILNKDKVVEEFAWNESDMEARNMR